MNEYKVFGLFPAAVQENGQLTSLSIGAMVSAENPAEAVKEYQQIAVIDGGDGVYLNPKMAFSYIVKEISDETEREDGEDSAESGPG